MSNEGTTQMLWGILENSKAGQPCASPVFQYLNLMQSLATIPIPLLDKLAESYRNLMYEVKEFKGFESLHASRGGFVSGGDDAFYMDFPAWVIAQGKELYTYAKSDGAYVIKSYIDHFGVPLNSICFENLMYPFSEVADLRRKGRSLTDSMARFIIGSGASVVAVHPLYVDEFSPENLIAFRFVYNIPRSMKDGSVKYWSLDVLNSDLADDQRLLLRDCLARDVLLKPHGDLYLSADERSTGLHSLSVEGKCRVNMLFVYFSRQRDAHMYEF